MLGNHQWLPIETKHQENKQVLCERDSLDFAGILVQHTPVQYHQQAGAGSWSRSRIRVLELVGISRQTYNIKSTDAKAIYRSTTDEPQFQPKGQILELRFERNPWSVGRVFAFGPYLSLVQHPVQAPDSLNQNMLFAKASPHSNPAKKKDVR